MKKIITILYLVSTISFFSQNNVGVGTLTPNSQAILEISSDDKGVLISRLTTIARTTLGSALTSAEDGMLVYDKDLTTFFYWDGPGLVWVQVGSGTGDDWGTDVVNTSGTNIAGDGTAGSPITITEVDGDITNEIELPTGGTNGQLLSTDGTGVYTWMTDDVGTDNQDLTIAGDVLSLTNDATTIDLSILKDHDWYEVGGTAQPDAITDNIFTQGNVGIGLASPNATLDVNGDVLYSANASTLFKVTSASDNIHLNMIKASTGLVNAQILFDGYGAPQDQGQIRFFTRWDPANGGAGTLDHAMSIIENGNVGIGILNPDPSAKLDVNSTDKGFLPPRIALTGHNDVTTIATPVEGLLVYNTATAGTGIQMIEPGYYYFNGTIWKAIGENSDWYLDNTNSFTGGLPLITSATVPTTGNRLYTNYVNLQKGVYFVNFYDCLSSATANYYVQTRAESSSAADLYSGFMNYGFNQRTEYSHAGFVIYVKKNGTPVRFYVYNPSNAAETLTIPHTVASCSSFHYYKISE